MPPITEIDLLEAKVAADPADADAWYALGVLSLRACAEDAEDAPVEVAEEALSRSLDLGRDSPWTHAALGYARELTMEEGAAALPYLRKAHALEPAERIFEIYFLTLLAESGAEAEALAGIEAAALREAVDLRSLGRDLEEVGFDVTALALLTNGFIHARNYFQSWLYDEAERVRDALSPGRSERLIQAGIEHCAGLQAELRASYRPDRVPESCRPLSTWAVRFGIGDDACRPALLARLPDAERAELLRDVDRYGPAAHEWLDTLRNDLMPGEASALLFLLLGAEELDG